MLWKPLPFLSRCQLRNLLTSRFVKRNWSSKYTMLILLLILATSTWGYSKLWGGGVPTSDIDHSRPSIRPLLLHTLNIWLAPSSPPSVQCPACPTVDFYLPPPPPPQDHLPTWASPVSIPEYRKPISLPSLTHHFPRLNPHLLPLPHRACRIPVTAAPRYTMTLYVVNTGSYIWALHLLDIFIFLYIIYCMYVLLSPR